MTTRDKHIAQKKKEIEKIEKQQARLIKQMQKLATAPYKRPATLMSRAGKLLAISAKVRSMGVQKLIIIAQPIPKRELGGVKASNMAIFKESGPEYIEWCNQRIYPNQLNGKTEII